jgi:rhodanese-related sulfurtransferase
MGHANTFVDLVEEARPRIKEMDVHTLNTMMNDNQPVIVIDVREDREWIQGHIPQAIHLGKGVIERDISKHVTDANTPLVLYCGGGYRSVLAADNIQKMGYNNVTSLAGGWRDWKENYPTETPA